MNYVFLYQEECILKLFSGFGLGTLLMPAFALLNRVSYYPLAMPILMVSSQIRIDFIRITDLFADEIKKFLPE